MPTWRTSGTASSKAICRTDCLFRGCIERAARATEVVARGTAEGALEGAVALGVAAEVGVEGGGAHAGASVDEVNEAHQAEARAEFDERETEISVELAAHLRRSGA